MEELLNQIARGGYKAPDGTLLTNSREFHALCQKVKEQAKKTD